jgi:leader peptidase (prepilin peptidase)/N-methyltransferase
MLLLTVMFVLIVAVVLVLGLCLGSFVNALVWRLHEQSALEGKKSKAARALRTRLSIISGRSMCPSCKHELAARDLVPVLSWLSVKGKCRYCAKPIGWQYPAVELVTAGLFIFSYFFWPLPLHGFGLFEFVPWLICLTGFVALAVYDIRWFLLPTKILRPLIGLAILQVVGLSLFYHGGLRTIAGALFGVLVASGIFYVLFIVSKGSWIGGGDVRLGMLLGLLIGGPVMSFFLIFVASTLGTVVALPLLLSHKLRRTSHVPFGPFLLAGAIITRLFGAVIIAWYRRHLLGA